MSKRSVKISKFQRVGSCNGNVTIIGTGYCPSAWRTVNDAQVLASDLPTCDGRLVWEDNIDRE